MNSLVNEFSKFQILIKNLNTGKFKFSIIAVTKLWSVPPNNIFSLQGYSPLQFEIRQTNGYHSVGGGVGM